MRKTRKGYLPRADQWNRIGLAGRLFTAAVLILLTAAITVGLTNQVRDRDRAAAAAAAAVAGPATLTEDGMIRVGDPAAPVVVTVTEDPQCALCRSFVTVTGPALDALIAQRRVAVDYDLVAIRDRDSTTGYSSRAVNASACVAEADISRWPQWQRELYDEVPAPGTPGRTDDELIELASRAGIDPTPQFRECVTTRRFGAYTAHRTERAVAAGLTHAPTVRVGATTVTNLTPEGLDAAVRTATSE
ncbi:thioredoxin domain-containing protein [Nocardia brasiliensis]|uniref:Thioredoxin domain-containing protein n=1 Tax=Nocardia brasiliensis TaxID=37326 RepID=A0A6G9XMU3_NOCBR|nr:thioredoxin domain-containing protein [Nocardia brasiliensis]QIS02170.1 thioredoxin domain-containing protein [Nocardia brasiliensis]